MQILRQVGWVDAVMRLGGDSFLVFVFDTLINISFGYLWATRKVQIATQIPSAYAASGNYANLFQNVLNTR